MAHERSTETRRLDGALEALAAALDRADLLAALRHAGAPALGADSIALYRVDGGALVPLDDAPAARAIACDPASPLGDVAVAGEERFLERATLAPDLPRGAWAALPLRADGRVVAALVLGFSGAQRFSDALRAELRAIARAAEIALRRVDLLARRAAELERLELAARAAGDLRYDCDERTGRVWRSDGMRALLGLAADELDDAGAWWWRRVHPDDRARVRQQDDDALARGADAVRLEYRVRHRDGALIPVRDHAVLLRDPAGRLVRRVGACIDLRTPAAAPLDEVFAHAPVGILVLDDALRVLRLNQRAAEMSGAPLADHLGRTVRDLLPDLADVAERLLRRVLATGEAIVGAELVGETPDAPGRRRHWHADYFPIRGEGGRPVAVAVLALEITAQRVAEQQLRERAEELERLLDLLPIGIYQAHDPLCRRVTGNAAAAALIETDPGPELAPIHPGRALDFVMVQGGRVLDERELPLRRAARGEVVAGEEYEIRRADGSVRHVFGYAAPLFDASGFVRGGLAALLDVTARKRLDQALRDAQERLTAFVDHSPVQAWLKDEAGRYVFVNPVAAAQLGVPPERWAGATDDALFDPATAAALRAHDEGVLADGRPTRFHERLDSPVGARQFLTSKFPVRDAGGRGYVGGIRIDVTDMVRAREAALESEARFRALADDAPVLIWLAGPGGCEFGNRAYLEFCGQSLAELRGSDLAARVHPDDRDDYARRYRDALARRERFDVRARIRRADGELRWVRSIGVPRIVAGELVGCVGVSLDITDTVRADAALRAADQRKDEFLATLAHELRNPLAPIRSAVEVLGLSRPAAPELERCCEIIGKQVAHMARLLDDLLDVSRITRDALTLRRERVDARSLLAGAAEATGPLFIAAGVDLEVAAPADPVPLDVDSVRISQVIGNLLANAARYTDAGGRVALRLRVDGDAAVIEVVDTGIGIADDMRERVFDLFAQVAPSDHRSRGGLGIGLALVRRLVALHGGSVAADSEGPGRGSTFTVRLPLARPGGEAPALARPASRPARVRRRVVVADDNVDAAETLAMYLELHDHEVRVAHDGEAAVALTREFSPDVVLLDLGMPKLDGLGAARAIRAMGRSPILLVALTGWGQESDRRRSADAGFDHHLTKPVELARLDALLAGDA